MILKHTREGEKTVEGPTSNTSILFVVAIRGAVAVDALILAVGATLLNLFINWALYYLTSRAKSTTE